MTTREFINSAFYGNTRKNDCSSVFKDGNNDLYSYGYHYPLLFRVGDKVVRNVRGYSSTTARHILWTRDIEAIDIHTLSGFRLSGTPEQITAELIRGQAQYVASLQDRIKHHREMGRRENTQVFASMQRDLAIANANLTELQA